MGKITRVVPTALLGEDFLSLWLSYAAYKSQEEWS